MWEMYEDYDLDGEWDLSDDPEWQEFFDDDELEWVKDQIAERRIDRGQDKRRMLKSEADN